jgi:RNA polymerase sigma factor (sigma-70 family)
VPGEEQRVADTELVAHALGKLSERQQQVVLWRYYFDQSVHETAERLGLTDSKVKDATHEAMSKLQRILGGAKEAAT